MQERQKGEAEGRRFYRVDPWDLDPFDFFSKGTNMPFLQCPLYTNSLDGKGMVLKI